jgi:transcriptional antiterminator RfaH
MSQDKRTDMPRTAAKSSRDKSWYLIFTKPRQEEVALANLTRQGYGVYLPRLRHWRKRGKRLLVVEPLFPRYLFIHLNSHTDNWTPIRSTLGVMSLVRFGTEPARVPDDLVAHLKSRENDEALHEWAEPKLAVGDRVRVAEGPLAGYEGVLLAKSGRERVTLLLDILGSQVRAQLARDQLESTKL